jgi:hypothetical protein
MDFGMRFSRVVTFVTGAIAFAACGASAPSGAGPPAPRVGPPPRAQDSAPAPAGASQARRRALAAFGRTPLAFARNGGQAAARVRYLARDGDTSLLFADRDVTLVFREAVAPAANLGHGLALRLRFVGPDPGVTLQAGPRSVETVNHLVGDASRWRRGLPTHAALTYRGVWPGIDLVFRGRGGRLKYEFHVAPGADVRSIHLAYRGVRRLAVGAGGRLLIRTAFGTLTDGAPVSYQRRGVGRVPVHSRYAPRGAAGYGFVLGPDYDPARPLVIDPGIAYSTFLGGTGADEGMGVAVDEHGSAYVTGRTLSADYPSTPGVFDEAVGGPYGTDAFVTKLDPSGSTVVYSTFVGGSDTDEASAIAIDGDGRAYITGQTWSTDYPTTAGAPAPAGAGDAFVTGLSADGSTLAHSTLLGGSGRDSGLAVAAAGRAVSVTGYTASADFPTTGDALDPSFNGTTDAFVTQYDTEDGGLAYSTFVGGSGGDAGLVAVDDQGGAYITGRTSSVDYPTTPNAFDSSLGGPVDAVVTKLGAGGSTLDYSTLLGGSGLDAGAAIAVDRRGRPHVTGVTASGDYPTSAGALDTSFNGVTDAFVTALDADGSVPAYSTFLGGADRDEGLGLALDEAGRDYVTGSTWSADHPTTADAVVPARNGSADVFVAKLGARASSLAYSTFLGGTGYDAGRGIAVDPSGRAVYVTGETLSPDHPTSPAAFDRGHNGGRDAFVTKLELGQAR